MRLVGEARYLYQTPASGKGSTPDPCCIISILAAKYWSNSNNKKAIHTQKKLASQATPPLNVIMTLIFPKIVWTCPLNRVLTKINLSFRASISVP